MKNEKKKNTMLLLVKIQLLEIFDFKKLLRPRDKKEKRGSTVLLITLIMVTIIMCVYAAMFAYAIALMGFAEQLPMCMMTCACLLTFITSFFVSRGKLFGFKDYDAVVSLPVSISDVIVSRMVAIYVYELAFAAGVIIPSIIVYAFFAEISVMFWIYFIISFFFIPLVPIVLASIFAVIINAAASRIKFKNAISTIFTLAFVVGIMALSFWFSSSVTMTEGGSFKTMAIFMTEKLGAVYPISFIYNAFISNGSFISFIIFISISAGLYAAFILLLTPVYSRLNAVLAASSSGSGYKKEAVKYSSPFMSLCKKELRRFFSTPIYVVNCGIGALMLLIGAVVIMFVDINIYIPAFETILPNTKSVLTCTAQFIMIMLIGLSPTTTCALSLEGSSLWILNSSPVKPSSVYLSKLAVNIIITAPVSLLASTVVAIKLTPSVIDLILLYILPLVYCVFTSVVGLALNIRWPNFKWATEVTAIKQSVPVFIMVFGSMIYTALFMVGFFLTIGKIPTWVIPAAGIVISSAISILLRKYTLNHTLLFED